MDDSNRQDAREATAGSRPNGPAVRTWTAAREGDGGRRIIPCATSEAWASPRHVSGPGRRSRVRAAACNATLGSRNRKGSPAGPDRSTRVRSRVSAFLGASTCGPALAARVCGSHRRRPVEVPFGELAEVRIWLHGCGLRHSRCRGAVFSSERVASGRMHSGVFGRPVERLSGRTIIGAMPACGCRTRPPGRTGEPLAASPVDQNLACEAPRGQDRLVVGRGSGCFGIVSFGGFGLASSDATPLFTPPERVSGGPPRIGSVVDVSSLERGPGESNDGEETPGGHDLRVNGSVASASRPLTAGMLSARDTSKGPQHRGELASVGETR